MRILIGGVPSSGTSLFRQILNRHPQVFCGPETNLFCYAELYQRWRSARRRLLFPGMLGMQKVDVRLIRGVHLDDPEIGWTIPSLHQLIRTHTSFGTFCDAFFEKPMSMYHKKHWAEKTPANVLQFRRFMQTFEDAYIIHVVRDPYDTIASLVARGMSAYQAASVYLLYSAHGLSLRGLPGYREVRYEALVHDVAGTFESAVLGPMDLQFAPEMLQAGNTAMSGSTRMPGWRSNEIDQVSARSVSRFQDEAAETQLYLSAALQSVCLKEAYMKQHQLQHGTVAQICADLNYPVRDNETTDRLRRESLRQERRSVLRALFLQRVYSGSMYPVELKRDN